MNTKPRLTGEPIMRILCNKTEKLVGYLYQWDNGDQQSAWFDEAVAEVRYEPMGRDRASNALNQRVTGRATRDPSLT